jgi:integrase
MATIDKRAAKDGGVSYRVQVRLKGYPTQVATFQRLTDAKKWAQQTESAIREGRHFKTTEAKKHTFAEAIDRYTENVLPKYTQKEQANRRPILTWWKDAIGVHVMADLSPAMFAECRDNLAKAPSKKGGNLSSDTIKKYFDVAKGVLKVCVNEWQWLEHSPLRDGRVELPELPRGRVRFLDDDERERLLTVCKVSGNPWLYTCVILALSTGMRQGELMGLRWSNVDLKAGSIILHETKNGERRRVPLAGLALELLREHAKVRRLDTDLLFPSHVNKQRPIDLRKPFETALKAAEIKDFHWHDLRHCTASYLAMNGASLAEIAEVLGHKTLQMVKRYAHLSDGHVSNVVRSMNEKMFGGG